MSHHHLKSHPLLLFLATLCLFSISKAGLGDLIHDLGHHIKDAGESLIDHVSDGIHDLGEDIDDIGDDIKNDVDQGLVDLVVAAALPGSTALFGEELDALFDDARNDRNVGTNSSAQIIEIMDIFDQVDINKLCDRCVNFANDLKDKSDDSDSHHHTRDAIEDVFNYLCKKHVNATVCTDAVKNFIGGIYDSIIDPTVNSTWACQRISLCPYPINNDTLTPYVQEVLQDKPPTNISNATGRATYQVLHMTDLHIDFHYQEGSWAQCGNYQCCRADDGAPPDSSQAAGYWGSLATCDIPPRTYEQFLQFVRDNFNISFILWTGDNIDHEVWRQEQSTQTVPTYNATQYLKEYFPNTTIYPMFGNHEGFFTDQYDTVGNGSAWLLDELGEMWEDWFDQEAFNEFKTKSYYATINEAFNLKIISLDTQTCDTLNFDLIRDSNVDPLNQLDWLRDELLDAENNNLTVFIMGHIPPGSFNCDPQWSARYRALIDRFTNIITGQFYGHTHNDQFQIVRSYNDSSPVGVIYIAPSLTTYSKLYPSFRIFEVDADTNQIVNYQQYRLNLTKWNSNTTGPISWDLAYTFLEEYNLTNTSYASFDILAEGIRANNQTAETYLFNFNSGGQSAANISEREIDYLYCTAKYSEPDQAMYCLGLNPSLMNLEYFASQYVPGLLPKPDSS